MSTPQRILVVDDEHEIADQIARRFQAEGWEVSLAFDGLIALDEAERFQPDAVVLDVMLPGLDGLEVCRRLQARSGIPVLMLTARDDEMDMLVGLGIGADDYMTKPFSMRELVARTRALLRRVERIERRRAEESPAEDSTVTIGPITVDIDSRRVQRDGSDVHLTPTEFELLVFLARNEGRVLSRETLLSHVWEWEDASATRTVDSHIKSLRRKLGSDVIRTVHGIGYALGDPT